MGEIQAKRRRMTTIFLAVVLALAVPLCIPTGQAHAAGNFQFNLLANGKNYSDPYAKSVGGSANATVQSTKTNTAMLAACGVVLRVHTEGGSSASESATYYTCVKKTLPYWSGFGSTRMNYKLWGQVAQSAGNTGTRVGGQWNP